MQVLLTRLKEELTKVTKLSTAAHIATVNQTRWHTSTYLAYVFAKDNLDTLQSFYGEEKNATAEPICDALEDRRAQVEEQLESYISTLAPAAKFLETISESRAGQSLQMYEALMLMIDELAKTPHGSPGHALRDLVHTEINASTEVRRLPLVKTVEFFFFAQFLRPGIMNICYDAWFTQRGGVIGYKEFREGLGFSEEELPEAEFDAFWKLSETSALIEAEDVEKWWRARSLKFPRLSQVALYIIHTPCVVTSCDTAISVLGSMFTTAQNRIDTKTAAHLVALRCNGDVLEQLPEGTRKRSFG
jgi:hypothetical protein